jgi:superfamily I DNA and/or RNA helicase
MMCENVRRAFASFNVKDVLTVQGREKNVVNLTGIVDPVRTAQ